MKSLLQVSPNEAMISTRMPGDLSSLHDPPKKEQGSIIALTKVARDNPNANTSSASKDARSILGSSTSSACGIALSFIGRVGNAVQNVCLLISTLNVCNNDNSTNDFDKVSNLTKEYSREERQIRYDLHKLKHIISRNTHHSMSTTQCIGRNITGNNGSNNVLKNGSLLPYFEKPTNSSDKNAESNSSATKRIINNKVVKFHYPHVTSLKGCPRVTKEDKGALFFTEHELDQYYNDRKSRLHGTVEVMAVELDSNFREVEVKNKKIMPAFYMRDDKTRSLARYQNIDEYNSENKGEIHDSKEENIAITLSNSRDEGQCYDKKERFTAFNWKDECNNGNADEIEIGNEISPISNGIKLRSRPRPRITPFSNNTTPEYTNNNNFCIETKKITDTAIPDNTVGIEAKINSPTEMNCIRKNLTKHALRRWVKAFSTKIAGKRRKKKLVSRLGDKQQHHNGSTLIKNIDILLSPTYTESTEEGSVSTINSDESLKEGETITLEFPLNGG